MDGLRVNQATGFALLNSVLISSLHANLRLVGHSSLADCESKH